MRIPWGLLVLVLLIGDAVSLWMLFGIARDAGYGVILSALATLAYVTLLFVLGVSVLVSGPVNAMRNALKGGVDPHDLGRRVLDGVLVAAAAVLLMVPGLVSDAVAVLLLFPLTRALFRPLARRGTVVKAGGKAVTFGYSTRWGSTRPMGGSASDLGRDAPRARVSDDPAMDVDQDEYRVE